MAVVTAELKLEGAFFYPGISRNSHLHHEPMKIVNKCHLQIERSVNDTHPEF